MPKFYATLTGNRKITETAIITIEADSLEEAKAKVEDDYWDGKTDPKWEQTGDEGFVLRDVVVIEAPAEQPMKKFRVRVGAMLMSNCIALVDVEAEDAETAALLAERKVREEGADWLTTTEGPNRGFFASDFEADNIQAEHYDAEEIVTEAVQTPVSAKEWAGDRDTDGQPCNVLNTYECDCGGNWTDTWSCGCDDNCPVCGTNCSPTKSEEIDEDGNVIHEIEY